MKKFCGMLALLLLLSACGDVPTPTAQVDDVSTIVAATMQSLTASAPIVEVPPTQPAGAPVSLNGISFVIPTGIATNAQIELQESVPPSEGMPWWEIHPAYVKYPLQGYLLSNTFHDPIIYVYPADEFIQMSEGVGLGINTLKSILTSPEQPLPEELPFLPTFPADQVFYSPEYPVPADGIPFDWDNYENVTTYIESVKQKLNVTDPNSFTPSLSTLDTMIQSISATGIP